MKIIPPIITSKRIKYLEVNLTKGIKDLYSENCKTLINKTEDDTEGKIIPCSWIGRTNIVQMTTPSKAIYTLNAIPLKILMAFFTELQ